MAHKPKAETVAKLLTKAREAMNSRGKHWIKDDLTDGAGRYCAIGGLNKAARRPQRYAGGRVFSVNENEARLVLATAISGKRPESIDAAEHIIMAFNDVEQRKWGDVSKMFRKAARMALR